MTLTEEEAATKRCPEGFWNPGGQTHVLNCIGSGCMAWRWIWMAVDDPSDWRPTDKGYCGKAGRPV